MTQDDISPLQARALLERYQLRPRKALGQNFLIHAGTRELIIKAAEIEPEDVILEIGPGLGALTERLIQEAAHVVSVELDDRYFPILEENFGDIANLSLVQGDILEINPGELGLKPGYVVVANIPYNITSAVIRHLMESNTPAARVVLTIQREVAERIIADPGEMSLLALGVQVFGFPAIQTHIPGAAFYPAPKVESSVLRIDMRTDLLGKPELIETLFKLARAGFRQKRKQLKNALAHSLPLNKTEAEHLLQKCEIDPRTRAEVLSCEDWFCLAEAYLQFSGA